MKLLTLARDLKRRKAREERGLFVTEGVRAAEELLRSSLRVHGALVAPQLLDAPRGIALRDLMLERGVVVQDTSAREFASAAATESPQGVIAIAEIPGWALATLAIPAAARLVVLDGVQDPGNVGTIIRTSAALGATAVVALPGTVDLWNAKVIRAAMGAPFHLPVLSSTWGDMETFLSGHGLPLWGAAADGEPVDRLRPPPERLALAVGNEGGGLSVELAARLERRVAVPISAAVESLNVAVATGILLYALRP